jgi:hypothetical protein
MRCGSLETFRLSLGLGTSGVILTVVGTGQTMKQTQAQVYSRIKNTLIPGRSEHLSV